MRSIDPPRPRSAPTVFVATTLDGRTLRRELNRRTLIVAIKTSCDGCRLFLESDLEELMDLEVDALFVSATGDDHGEWHHARHEVLIAPALLEALDVRWPPFYVLIEPEAKEVLVEGVVFGPRQVAEEIGPYLSR